MSNRLSTSAASIALSLFRASEPSGVRVNTRTGPKETPFAGPAWWIAALALAAALLVQVEFARFLTFRGGEPSFVLVLVVWYALHTDWRRAALFGLAAGVCEDTLGAGTGASLTLSTLAAALFANVLGRWFFADSIVVASVVAFLATLVRSMIFWVAMALTMSYPPGYARLHFHEAVWAAILNALVIIAGVLASRRWGRTQ